MQKRKIAALMRSLLMAGSALSACGEKEDPAATGGTTEVTTEATTEAVPGKSDFEPVDAKYDGDFTILVGGKAGNSNCGFKDFSNIEATERTVLEEAIYRRNKAVEELYGMRLPAPVQFRMLRQALLHTLQL